MAPKALVVTALLITLIFFSWHLLLPQNVHQLLLNTQNSLQRRIRRLTICPTDTLKLGVCADLFGLVNAVAASPAKTPCCELLQGFANLEAAVCLCTALITIVLRINLNVPVDLILLLIYIVAKNFLTAFNVLEI